MIIGKKIYLEALSSTHSEAILEILNDIDIALGEGRNEFPINQERQSEWLKNSLNDNSMRGFAVMSLETKKCIGYTSFRYVNPIARVAHIAIKFGSDIQGKGYGTDTIKVFMAFLFYKMNINRLQGHIAEYNTASQRLFIDKCGWQKEGIAREAIFMNGQLYNNVMVAILRSDYEAFEIDSFYLNYSKKL